LTLLIDEHAFIHVNSTMNCKYATVEMSSLMIYLVMMTDLFK
jgi:hypothetical protein